MPSIGCSGRAVVRRLHRGPEGRFGLTPLADALRSDAPGSVLPVVLMLGDPQYQRPGDV